MDGFTGGIIRHRRLVIALFLICTVVCAVLFLGVEVNYDLTDYLPEDAESTVALDLMLEEFGSGIPNTRVMAVDLTIAEALELKEEIAAAPGVTDVMWLDDVADLTTPVELMDEATVEQYWKDGKALFSVTIESGLILSAAGFCLGFESSLEVVAELGILLCRGTLLSMAMVLLALPALLMIFDPLTARLTLKAGFLKKTDKEVETK